MKKLMLLAMGLGLALGSVSFAQDSGKMDDSKMSDSKSDKKMKKHKKSKKPAADATSTDKKM